MSILAKKYGEKQIKKVVIKMLHLKNISKWSLLYRLNSEQVQLSRKIVNLEFLYLQQNINELSYRRQKASLENQIEDVQTQQNNLRKELYEG